VLWRDAQIGGEVPARDACVERGILRQPALVPGARPERQHLVLAARLAHVERLGVAACDGSDVRKTPAERVEVGISERQHLGWLERLDERHCGSVREQVEQ